MTQTNNDKNNPSARDVAQTVLERYWDRQFPVNPSRIAQEMHLSEEVSTPSDTSSTPIEQRYDVACSLGLHLAIQSGVQEIFPQHDWAKSFALELLMPEDVLLGLWARGCGMFRIAGTFCVTFVLARARLQMLGLK